MNTTASVLCALATWACATPAPDVATLQTAYEREAVSPASEHDRGLHIVKADCRRDGGVSRHVCYITFTSADDPEQRLYFDAVAVEHVDGVWALTSGLCRR